MGHPIEDIDFPEKLQPLFDACWRYVILEGGRGGSKSWGIARALLVLMILRPGLRVLCAREIQKSIDQSVYQLLKDQISLMKLDRYFDVQANRIIGPNGGLIVFAGLQTMNATNIKSYESIDICWVEEAQSVKRPSWEILIPTIRKEGSQIWVSMNPELDTDDAYIRFIENTPPKSIHIHINYPDNPWFPGTLEMERQHAFETLDTETYNHIWLGKPRTTLAGAIYANEVASTVRHKRYRPVPYDPSLPVHTCWDMGWNDQNSIVFFQKLRNEVMIIDYAEASFMKLSDWVKFLDSLPYAYGTDILPWDGNTTSRQTGMSDKQILKSLGRRKVINGRQISGAAENRIVRSRSMFSRVFMDNTPAYSHRMGETLEIVRGGGRLMECLKRYSRNVPATTGEPGGPKHDEFSHGADSFGEMAVNIERVKNEMMSQPLIYEGHEQSVKGVM